MIIFSTNINNQRNRLLIIILRIIITTTTIIIIQIYHLSLKLVKPEQIQQTATTTTGCLQIIRFLVRIICRYDALIHCHHKIFHLRLLLWRLLILPIILNLTVQVAIVCIQTQNLHRCHQRNAISWLTCKWLVHIILHHWTLRFILTPTDIRFIRTDQCKINGNKFCRSWSRDQSRRPVLYQQVLMILSFLTSHQTLRKHQRRLRFYHQRSQSH